MKFRSYLPSAGFTLMVGSIALAGGLVWAAEYFTQPVSPAQLSAVSAQSAQADNWQATLDQIQAQSASSLPTPPDPNLVSQLLAESQTNNVTDNVGRSLLINLSNAKSQGLGDDIPTQNALVAAAAAQIQQNQATTTHYTASDLNVVPASSSTLRAFGNGAMQALSSQTNASEQATYLSLDEAVEGGDKTQPANLAAIGAAYRADALALLAVPVPQTLAPLDLQAINNLLDTSATYQDMEQVNADPVLALTGLQTYESYMDQGARVFINIAQELNKDGILFNKDEPGSAWSTLLPSS